MGRSLVINMTKEVLQGILIPFLGTSLGASCVLFMKGELNVKVQKALTGFAAGVMVAASIAGIYRILDWYFIFTFT